MFFEIVLIYFFSENAVKNEAKSNKRCAAERKIKSSSESVLVKLSSGEHHGSNVRCDDSSNSTDLSKTDGK